MHATKIVLTEFLLSLFSESGRLESRSPYKRGIRLRFFKRLISNNYLTTHTHTLSLSLSLSRTRHHDPPFQGFCQSNSPDRPDQDNRRPFQPLLRPIHHHTQPSHCFDFTCGPFSSHVFDVLGEEKGRLLFYLVEGSHSGCMYDCRPEPARPPILPSTSLLGFFSSQEATASSA